VQFYLNGNAVGSAVPINSSGVATLSQAQVNLSAGSYPVKAIFSSTNANFAGSSGSTTQAVTQENAFILYSGDTIAQVGTTLNLRATVWDSAAAGYPGVNPMLHAGRWWEELLQRKLSPHGCGVFAAYPGCTPRIDSQFW